MAESKSEKEATSAPKRTRKEQGDETPRSEVGAETPEERRQMAEAVDRAARAALGLKDEPEEEKP